MAGGRLKIEYCPPAPSSGRSRSGRGQRRRARRRPLGARLLVRQEQGGLPVRHRPGLRRVRPPCRRLDLCRRRLELYDRTDRRRSWASTSSGSFGIPMPPQPLGWFKKRGQHRRRHAGAEVPHRRSGRRPDARMGMRGTQLPGGEIVPGDGARRDRRLRVQQPVLGQAASARQDVAKLLHVGSYHQAAEFFEIIFNKKIL